MIDDNNEYAKGKGRDKVIRWMKTQNVFERCRELEQRQNDQFDANIDAKQYKAYSISKAYTMQDEAPDACIILSGQPPITKPEGDEPQNTSSEVDKMVGWTSIIANPMTWLQCSTTTKNEPI